MKLETRKELEVKDAGNILTSFFKELWSTILAGVRYLRKLHEVWNEGWVLVALVIVWHYGYYLSVFESLGLIRFVYATIGTAIAHFVVTLMLWLSHPNIVRYFYGLFSTDLYKAVGEVKSQTIQEELKHTRLKYSLIMLVIYLSTFLILVATY